MLEAMLRVSGGPSKGLLKSQLKDCLRPSWRIARGQAEGLLEVELPAASLEYMGIKPALGQPRSVPCLDHIQTSMPTFLEGDMGTTSSDQPRKTKKCPGEEL